MDNDLFSCRNCIYNPAQTTVRPIGQDVGYCATYKTFLYDAHLTTCRHLHRKDCPEYLVLEGIEFHREEFPEQRRPLSLENDIDELLTVPLAEPRLEEHRTELMEAVIRTAEAKTKWRSISITSHKNEMLHQNAFASFVRAYPENAVHWKSYRRFMGEIVQQLGRLTSDETGFSVRFEDTGSARLDVLWNFISSLQEHGKRIQQASLMTIDLEIADLLLENDLPLVGTWFEVNQTSLLEAVDGAPHSFKRIR